MLEIREIHKAFGELEVLRGVNIHVKKGEVVAVLGPSGSGKTTLLRCANFLEKADSGTLIFDGETFELNRISKKDIARIRRKTGFVFQNYNLFRNRTALENVTEGLIIGRKMPKIQAIEVGKRALEKVGLSDRCDYYPSQLSGGQQQRVAIARAIAARPPVILADEPTGNLDSHSTQDIMSVLKDLHKSGRTVILITHDNDIAAQVKRVIRIKDGRVEADYMNEGETEGYEKVLEKS